MMSRSSWWSKGSRLRLGDSWLYHLHGAGQDKDGRHAPCSGLGYADGAVMAGWSLHMYPMPGVQGACKSTNVYLSLQLLPVRPPPRRLATLLQLKPAPSFPPNSRMTFWSLASCGKHHFETINIANVSFKHQRMLGLAVRPCWAQRARMVTRLPALLSRAQTVLKSMTSMAVGLWRASTHLFRLPGRSLALDNFVAHACVLGWGLLKRLPCLALSTALRLLCRLCELRGLYGSVNCDQRVDRINVVGEHGSRSMNVGDVRGQMMKI